MAKAAPVAEPEAPPADDVYEVRLPDAEGEAPLRLDTLEDDAAAEPEGEPGDKPVAKVAPVKPKAEKPEAEPEPEKAHEPLSPAAREERRKRKIASQKWQEATEERDAALLELDRLRRRPGSTKEQREAILAKADTADSMRALMETTIEEMDRRDQMHRDELFALSYQHKCDLSEMRARIAHADYDATMQASGIYEAVQIDPATGTWKNQEIGKRIYLTRDGKLRADPAEAAYQLAIGKMEFEASRNGNAEDGEPPVTQSSKAETDEVEPTRRAAPASERRQDLDAARREGAREVAERVAVNASRPKGISNLRSAGPPSSARLTRRQLDKMQEEEPAAYERLIQKNPDLKRWHLGGF